MFSNDNQDKSIQMSRVIDRRSILLGSTTLAAASALSSALETAQAQQPPAAAAGSTTNTNRLVRTFTGDNHQPISCIAVSLDGTRIVSGSGLGSEGVSFWNLDSGDMLHKFALGDGGADSVAFSPDGRTAAAASIDDQIITWDTSSFNQLGLIRANVGVRTNRVAFSADGQLVLSVYDSNLVLLDTSLHQKSAIRTPPGATVFAAAFSPEGRFVVAGSVRFDRGDDIVVYDLLSGQQTIHFSGHPGAGVTSVAWSGNNILSGSGNGSVKLWNSASGAAIRSFAGHTKPVDSVALDSSGALALSGSDDGTMKLWAVGSSTELQTFDHADGPVNGVAFASGARFAVSGGGKTVKLWDLSGLAS
jgi:WD40 repeat protein